MIIRNFLFHQVSPVKDRMWDPMDPELFERIIKYLSRNYLLLTIEDIVLNNMEKNYNRPIASICFDDGYKNNIEYALPILEKYKCPCSFYVVTDCIGYNRLTWTHEFEYLFQNTKKSGLLLDDSIVPENLMIHKWKKNKTGFANANKLKSFLKTLRHDKRSTILHQIKKSFNDVELPKLMMNWDDLTQLNNAGFTIGSHSMSHLMLGSITEDELIEQELFQSKKVIKEKTGTEPITISYPIGSYNSKVVDISKKAGYKLGLAVEQRFYDTERDSNYEIPRTELYNEPWLKTQMRISGSLEKIKKAVRYK